MKKEEGTRKIECPAEKNEGEKRGLFTDKDKKKRKQGKNNAKGQPFLPLTLRGVWTYYVKVTGTKISKKGRENTERQPLRGGKKGRKKKNHAAGWPQLQSQFKCGERGRTANESNRRATSGAACDQSLYS